MLTLSAAQDAHSSAEGMGQRLASPRCFLLTAHRRRKRPQSLAAASPAKSAEDPDSLTSTAAPAALRTVPSTSGDLVCCGLLYASRPTMVAFGT